MFLNFFFLGVLSLYKYLICMKMCDLYSIQTFSELFIQSFLFLHFIELVRNILFLLLLLQFYLQSNIFHGKINDKSQSAAIAPNRNTMKYNLEILFLNNLFKVRQALAVPIKVIVLLVLWFIQQHRQQIQSSTWLHAD